jgi:uncharacterized integral membrane protein
MQGSGAWFDGGDMEMGELSHGFHHQASSVSAASAAADSLHKEREALTHINERQENRIEKQQSKINKLIGLYLMFQGVILTSVAQGSFLHCHNWWLPFTLSAIAAAAIIMAVLHMLLKISLLKIELDKNRRHGEQLDRLILRQKQQLPSFAMEDASNHSHWSFHHQQHDADLQPLSCGDCLYRASYPVIVLIMLILFTVFILIGCHRILCFPGPGPDDLIPPKS